MNDLDRLISEYQRRELNLIGSKRYSNENGAYRFMKHQLQERIRSWQDRSDIRDFGVSRLLEIGCGNGNVLGDFNTLGAPFCNLIGIDLLYYRLAAAKEGYPEISFACANGQRLPFADREFDVVLQFTAFSSVLDSSIKADVAGEMCRVLKPDGLILWYDFWLNPTNNQTRGIRLPEIRSLFPHCTLEAHKITLAPPIARRVVPVSWILAELLEKLTIFNSHYLVAIRKNPETRQQ